MQQKQMQFLGALRSGQRFLDDNEAALGDMSASQSRRELDQVVARITQLASEQDTSRMRAVGERTRERRLAKLFHRRHLRPIIAMAKLHLPMAPQLASITAPREGRNVTQLVEQGRAIADAVEPFEDIFVERALRPDFLGRLRAAADELVESTANKTALRTTRTGATESLADEVKVARKVLAVINAMIRAVPDLPAPLITEWQATLRLAERRASSLTSSTSPTPTTQSTSNVQEVAKAA